MMKRPLVIYHADCTDGFGAAYAAWLALGDDAEYLPCSYGCARADEMKIEGRRVYILDFSFDKETMQRIFADAGRVVWLDHHKTAFEMWCGGIPSGGRYCEDHAQTGNVIQLDNNKSGALLAWEYFHPHAVPDLIRHIDDRDRWQFKLEDSKKIHAFLQSIKPWDFGKWKRLVNAPESVWNGAVLAGEGILRVQDQNVLSMAKNAQRCRIPPVPEEDNYVAVPVWRGLSVNACLHQSELGHELANQSGTFGLIWYVGQDGRANCSLRSNGEYDVSAIAKLFGGGGHKNAAGFQTDVQTVLLWLR